MSQQDTTLETPWILPSFCARNNCPEVRRAGDMIQVRSKGSDQIATLTKQDFADLLKAGDNGEYDDLIAG